MKLNDICGGVNFNKIAELEPQLTCIEVLT